MSTESDSQIDDSHDIGADEAKRDSLGSPSNPARNKATACRRCRQQKVCDLLVWRSSAVRLVRSNQSCFVVVMFLSSSIDQASMRAPKPRIVADTISSYSCVVHESFPHVSDVATSAQYAHTRRLQSGSSWPPSACMVVM